MDARALVPVRAIGGEVLVHRADSSDGGSVPPVQPSPDERKAGVVALFGALAPTYDTVIPHFDTFARRLVDIARLQRGDRVLDLACGRGACLRAAAAAVGPEGRVVGVDLAPEMVERTATDVAAERMGNVEVRVGDAEHLDADDGSFDAVVCGFGVFFFPAPDAAMTECRRVLRPGGRFAASTYAHGEAGYPWAADVATELGRPPTLPTSPVLTAEGLRVCLERAGFVDIRTTPVEGRFVFPDVDAYIAWNWSTGQRRMLVTLDDGELRRFRDLSAERLEAHAVDGGFEYVQHADVTVAARA
jgi:SAM-dependent methyltransferase